MTGPKLTLAAAVGMLLSGTHLLAQLPPYSVTAQSLTSTDVQAAVDDVVQAGGGTVLLPAGDGAWATPVLVAGNVGIIGKGASETRISNIGSARLLIFNQLVSGQMTTHSELVRLSGIGFFAAERTDNLIQLVNTDNYRIDHCSFEGVFHRLVVVTYTPRGLIDNNTVHRTWAGEPGMGLHPDDSTGYILVADPVGLPDKPPLPSNIVNGYTMGVAATDQGGIGPMGTTVVSRLQGLSSSSAAVFDLNQSAQVGRVTRLFFFVEEVATNPTIDIGIFTEVAPNTLTTRSVLEDVPVTAGMNILQLGRDFTEGELAVVEGDYLGVYSSSCTLSFGYSADNLNWSLPGDQIPCSNLSFGPLSRVGTVQIVAELDDDAGTVASMAAEWDAWYSGAAAASQRNGIAHDGAWRADDLDVHCIEDNTIICFKGAVGPWAGNLMKFVVRHNHFIAESYIKYYLMIFNSGTHSAVVSDNIFEQLGSQDDGNDRALDMHCSGLVYNNVFRNFSRVGVIDDTRAYQGSYFTDSVALRELYYFNNTFEGCGQTWVGGNDRWVAEGISVFSGAPGPGDRLFEAGAGRYDFAELAYPHPLRSVLFSDGFESGDAAAWSSAAPSP